MKPPLIDDTNKVVFIMGPTAAGKTAAVVELARRYNIEVINADAAQVYRQMNIGTAKPTTEELAHTPHQLIDFIDPTNTYSAADFRGDALAAIANAQLQHKTPVLVGGSMFYFKALEHGLSELPPANKAVREKIAHQAKENGWQSLHARLADIDPITAANIDPGDPQRIQRALEIYRATGLPPSASFARAKRNRMPFKAVKLVVMPGDRRSLHQRIEQRFLQMLKAGLIEEVEQLRGRGDLSLELPSMRTVGYRQVWQFLEGQINHQQMIDQALAATRQLAKRQLTWLRNQSGLVWFVGYNGRSGNYIYQYFA